MDHSSKGGPPCCSPPEGCGREKSCCATPVKRATGGETRADFPWIRGQVSTPVGAVARASTVFRMADRWGAWKARWGIGRMRYGVNPGLYAVGDPTPESPVFVSANYKMSFDRLRCELGGRDGWILVLDTRGINVWCAAGKGTFGTEEIVHRASLTRVAEVVSHRTLILPQLGAPGVSAHEVRRATGFRVVYGPVRAKDLPAFLDAGMKATTEMRRVRFTFADRMVLVPLEIFMYGKYALPVALGLFLLSGLDSSGYSTARALSVGSRSAALFLGAYVCAAVLTPALLPWLPGRSFSAKGAWLGGAMVLGAGAWIGFRGGWFDGALAAAAWAFLVPAVASFLAMNFTGASTYTSLSGVRREMKVAVPIQMVLAAAGVALWITGRFV